MKSIVDRIMGSPEPDSHTEKVKAIVKLPEFKAIVDEIDAMQMEQVDKVEAIVDRAVSQGLVQKIVNDPADPDINRIVAEITQHVTWLVYGSDSVLNRY